MEKLDKSTKITSPGDSETQGTATTGHQTCPFESLSNKGRTGGSSPSLTGGLAIGEYAYEYEEEEEEGQNIDVKDVVLESEIFRPSRTIRMRFLS